MANTQVVMDTSHGTMKIELEDDKAPITVKNFLAYVDEGFFNGTIFHRVISNFMIQGGGFLPGMQQKTTKPAIKNESTNGLANKRGTLAMARTNVPDSATAQFFINVVDNDFLDRANSRDRVLSAARLRIGPTENCGSPSEGSEMFSRAPRTITKPSLRRSGGT